MDTTIMSLSNHYEPRDTMQLLTARNHYQPTNNHYIDIFFEDISGYHDE